MRVFRLLLTLAVALFINVPALTRGQEGPASQPGTIGDPRSQEAPTSQPGAATDTEPKDIRKAKRLFEQAETLYRLGKFDDARRAYEAALQLRPDPSLIFNIAQCYRQLKNKERAIFYYRLFLSDWERSTPGTSPPNEAEVRRFIEELEKPEAPVPAPQGMPTSKPAAPRVNTPSAPVDSQAVAKRRSKTIWGYAFLGVGVALGATAAALYGIAKSQGDDAHQQYMDATESDDILEHHGDLESANKKIIASYVFVGAAAVSVGISLYHLLTRPSLERADHRSRTAVLPLQGGAAFSLGGRF